MKVIQHNPYRTLGLLVGATAREQERQIRRLKQLIEAEQALEDDFSFPTLGEVNRTVESVVDASSKLNLDQDKINAALFWFYNGSHTDEPAFEAIKEGDLDQVLNIWSKLTSTQEVSQRNASAYNNLSTLYLSGILEGTNSNEALLEQGISLKLKFLESDFIKDFKTLVTDETFKTTKKDLQLLFLKEVQGEIEKKGGITSDKFIEILNQQSFSAKEDFLKSCVQKPIEQIEKQIEECKSKRVSNKSNAITFGKNLFQRTSQSLKQLKGILGTSDLKFTSISDKVALEIFYCGRDYFQHYKDSDTDPSSSSMDLFKRAKSLAVGNIAVQTCTENINDLQEWIDDKPERDKHKLITEDLVFITSKLERFQKLNDTTANAKDLVDSCKPRLNNIKSALGAYDDFYLKISSAVVNNAQGMLVTVVNKAQEDFGIYRNLADLKSKIVEAYNVTTSLSSFDMVPNLRTQFQKNREVITGIKNQLTNVSSSTGKSSGSSGCYIATMAYGNYDHPQVMILRQFRDNVLDQSRFGRWFIKNYYHYSPKLVEKMKNKKVLNSIIRKSLNQFIKVIK